MTTNTETRLSKVPEVTVLFWVIKVLTTGMGETTSDFFVKQFVPEIAVVVSGVVLVIALVLQFRAPSYIPWIYWFAVVMVSIFGTMVADVIHIVIGVPYLVSAAVFAFALAGIFTWWFVSERTLSIHSITTRRREFFYWATVLTTFALGTAIGDLTATTFGLGYFASGVLFAIVIAVPAVGWRWGLPSVFSFWFAYIITRPLGASFADWLGVSTARGGLNVGTGPVSIALAILIAVLVGVASRAERRTQLGALREQLGE